MAHVEANGTVPGVGDDDPDDVASGPRLADLGESGLLARMLPLLPAGAHTLLGPGDDAAVVRAGDGRVVATTDVLVEGRDFRRDWSSAQDVGWKAAAQNLADIAAMGAAPTALLVALVAPADLPAAWALGLAEGIVAACAGTGAAVVGGDLSSGASITVSVTALGDLQGRAPVLRSGASPGQDVALAGTLGWSAAGLDALRRWGPDEAAQRVPDLLAAHRRPRPPYGLGVAAAAGALAMIDVSDGLLRDAGRIAAASGVSIDLDDVALGRYVERLRPAAQALGADPWEWVLGGGEDHGMLAVFINGQAPAGFTVIGHTHPALTGWPAALVAGQDPYPESGWDHFASPPGASG